MHTVYAHSHVVCSQCSQYPSQIENSFRSLLLNNPTKNPVQLGQHLDSPNALEMHFQLEESHFFLQFHSMRSFYHSLESHSRMTTLDSLILFLDEST